LVKAFQLSPTVTEVHVIPGSDGMAQESICHKDLDWRDFEKVIQFCTRLGIDFVMVGPEDPLVAGLCDALRERGIHSVGPDRDAAQLEGSKIFAKQFMAEAGIPTSPFQIVQSVEETLEASAFFTPPYVLKADGLCAGKGVFICKTKEELRAAAEKLFVQKIFSEAGARALLEQFIPGYEVSYLILTNGEESATLPMAQDHKRLLDGDQGPNTGGMGTLAPVALSDSLRRQIETDIVAPIVRQLGQRQFVYRGVLFIGLMITEKGPQVLEFNTRFGDPETQVILPLLDHDVAQLFLALSKGEVQKIKVKSLAATCVIMAARGYPESPEKGHPIQGLNEPNDPNSWVIHSGTLKKEGQYFTHGGRVVGCVGVGTTLEISRQEAYRLTERISWEGSHFRHDIGAQLLKTGPLKGPA